MKRTLVSCSTLSRVALTLGLLGGCAASTPGPDAGPGTDTGSPPMDAGGGLCGNGSVDDGEECDGADLASGTCVTLGYAGGALSCLADCSYDKTVCEDEACGNGAIDAGEECDGAALGGATCESEDFVGGGVLGCNADCELDTSDCSACGDTVVHPGEECDGANIGGANCMNRGFLGGTLVCDDNCGFDTSGCFDATCGDDTRAGSEDCDGADLGGADCTDVGFASGTLGCNSDCTFAIAACNNCGDGAVGGTEQCDGAEHGGATCETEGFTMGTLGCTAACVLDTSGCSTAACGNGTIDPGELCDDANATTDDGCSSCAVDPGWACTGSPSSCSPVCGNAMIHGGEECDGANLEGATCVSRGFTGGTLSCSSSCRLNESACTSTTCGNLVVDLGEECDDGNTTSFDGCSSTCQVDETFDLPLRLRNGDGSNHGMLEVRFEGVWREVCDDTYGVAERQAMANVVCGQLGYTGTGHEFLEAFGGGSGNPVMDNVECDGSEASLAQCDFRGWNVEDCSGVEAVGFRCMPGEGDIRLVDGPHGMEGRLQIFHAGAWGEVCDDYFDGAYGAYFGYSTATVCQQLGYADGIFLSTYDAPSDDSFVLDDVNCTGTERRIGDCPHQPYGTENCYAAEGAGFRCSAHADGAVRLADGAGRNHGRVEILHDGVWGTICDDGLELSGAARTNFVTVGCGQLGFSGAGSAPTTGFSDGVDPIFMDNVACVGSESSLASCPFAGWGVENCWHGEDIGLQCTP